MQITTEQFTTLTELAARAEICAVSQHPLSGDVTAYDSSKLTVAIVNLAGEITYLPRVLGK